MKRSDVAPKLEANVPRDSYIARIIEKSFAPSKSSGRPMVTLKCEIISNNRGEDIVDNPDGSKSKVAGVPFSYYLIVDEKAIGDVFAFLDKVGINLDEIDESNPLPQLSGLDGLKFEAIISSSPRVALRQDRTPILDADGKEVISGIEVKTQLRDVIGVARV